MGEGGNYVGKGFDIIEFSNYVFCCGHGHLSVLNKGYPLTCKTDRAQFWGVRAIRYSLSRYHIHLSRVVIDRWMANSVNPKRFAASGTAQPHLYCICLVLSGYPIFMDYSAIISFLWTASDLTRSRSSARTGLMFSRISPATMR